VNSRGSSIPSDEILVALVDKPEAPLTVSKVSQLSSKTSVYVEWTAVAAGTLPSGSILGYVLTVTNRNEGASWVAFDGNSLGLFD